MSDPRQEEEQPDELESRFPALNMLAALGKGKIPFVQQLSEIECGAASLTMVLGYYGRHVSLDEVREVLGPGRDGVTALGIINAAEYFGLRGRGVRVDLDELELLERGTILHWKFSHFVVLDRVRDDSVEIVDPAIGRRRVPMEEFSRSFTGVALDFEPGDDFRTEKRRAGGVWAFAKRLMLEYKSVLFQVLIVTAFLQLVALSVPLLTSLIVDRVLPRGDHSLLKVVGVGLMGVVAFQFASQFLRSHLLLALRTRIDSRMQLSFLDHLASLPYPFFQIRSAGDLLQRLQSNSQVREILTSSALSALLDGMLVVVYLVILVVASPLLAGLAVGIGVLYLAVFFLSRGPKRELASQMISKGARSSSHLIEMLSGMDTLKSLGAEQRSTEAWSHLFVDELNASIKQGKLDAIVAASMQTIGFASPLVMLVAGGMQVLDGDLSLGNMLALTSVAAGFLTPLAALVDTALQLTLVASYVERIDDVLKAAPEQERGTIKPARRLSGNITLNRVSFRYSPLAPLVLKEVSVDIPPGIMVGIVGKSGAGKSTMLQILAGLQQPTSGRVLYDGHSLNDFDLRSVRQQLGVVTQNPMLFGGTVRANIGLCDPQAPFEELVRAATAACVHEEILQMPLGYDTPLTDRGASLSGGQRQRLALARALLGRPAALILDEATSALDGITERGVQKELAKLRCTRIVIAHRLSTIRDADLILVMEDGALVEQGDHAHLMSLGGLYASLVMPDQPVPGASAPPIAPNPPGGRPDLGAGPGPSRPPIPPRRPSLDPPRQPPVPGPGPSRPRQHRPSQEPTRLPRGGEAGGSLDWLDDPDYDPTSKE
jgi:ABC-type bacteriocin/lantibiotic exporter with double-glycine peptidase domain